MDARIIEALNRLDIPTADVSGTDRLRDDLGMDSAETIDLIATLETICVRRFEDDGTLMSKLLTLNDVQALVSQAPEPVR